MSELPIDLREGIIKQIQELNDQLDQIGDEYAQYAEICLTFSGAVEKPGLYYQAQVKIQERNRRIDLILAKIASLNSTLNS